MANTPALPTLELFQYTDVTEDAPNQINTPGIAHLAVQVDDVEKYTGIVLVNGGTRLGNIIELQTWN